MVDLQDRIARLVPPGMGTATALQLASTGDLGRGGRAAQDKKNGKSGKTGTASLAPPSNQPMIPAHFVSFTFHLPGREPFSVRTWPFVLSRSSSLIQFVSMYTSFPSQWHDSSFKAVRPLQSPVELHIQAAWLKLQWPSSLCCCVQEFVDPNEPRYCFCQQPSQGDMIGCDGENCKHEWFHYACVDVTDAPEFWLCPDCQKAAG